MVVPKVIETIPCFPHVVSITIVIDLREQVSTIYFTINKRKLFLRLINIKLYRAYRNIKIKSLFRIYKTNVVCECCFKFTLAVLRRPLLRRASTTLRQILTSTKAPKLLTKSCLVYTFAKIARDH